MRSAGQQYRRRCAVPALRRPKRPAPDSQGRRPQRHRLQLERRRHGDRHVATQGDQPRPRTQGPHRPDGLALVRGLYLLARHRHRPDPDRRRLLQRGLGGLHPGRRLQLCVALLWHERRQRALGNPGACRWQRAHRGHRFQRRGRRAVLGAARRGRRQLGRGGVDGHRCPPAQVRQDVHGQIAVCRRQGPAGYWLLQQVGRDLARRDGHLWHLGQFADPARPDQSISTFGFTVIYNGHYADGASLLQPLLALGPLTCAIDALTLPEFELINGSSTQVEGRSGYIRAGVMPPEAFSPAAIAVFEKYMACAPSKDSFLVWTHAGGHISKPAADATAFVHRGGRFIPELKAMWDTPGQARANIEWAHAFFDALAPHFCGNYVNYIDPLLANWTAQYYGANYARLLRVKQAVDPVNVFRFQQSVGSDFEPGLATPLDLAPLNRTFID